MNDDAFYVDTIYDSDADVVGVVVGSGGGGGVGDQGE